VTAHAYLELVRGPAVLSVLGDTAAGAAAAGSPLTGRRALLPLASACLYAGGMALNDWADRDLDAVERPERPIPSGRVPADRALAVAVGLHAAGLAVAALAGGRRSLAVAVPLAACVWLYDARLRDGPAGPGAMAACRGLDVLLGAGAGRLRAAAPAAAALAAHTAAVTVLSRGEVHGTTARLAAAVAATTVAVAGTTFVAGPVGEPAGRPGTARAATAAALAAYLARALPAQAAAVREPTAARARAATGQGIRAMVPLQAALVARAGRTGTAAALGGVAVLATALRRAAGRRAVSET
jgi:4-hydroxybenzoate polyprenyltransferase